MSSPAGRDEVLGAVSVDRRKEALAGAVTVVVLIVVFVGVLPRFADYSAAWDAIRSMSILSLVWLVATLVLSLVAYPWPFRLAVPGMSYGSAFMVSQTGFTIANAVPAGGAVGIGVQYSMLARAGFSRGASSAGVGINAVFNILATLALPVLGVLGLLIVGSPTGSQITAAVFGFGFVAIIVLLAGLVLRSRVAARRVGDLAERFVEVVTARSRRDRSSGISDSFVRFSASTAGVVRQRWAALSVSSLAVQLTQGMVLVAAMRITESSHPGDAVPWIAVIAAFGLARLATFIPITPGGLGTVDAGLAGLLVAFGATRTDALAATLLWRAASWLPQVLLGTATWVIWRARTRPARNGGGQ